MFFRVFHNSVNIQMSAVVHRLGRHAKGYDLTDPQSRLVNSTFYNGVYTFHMQVSNSVPLLNYFLFEILVLHYQLWDFPNKEVDLRLLFAYGKGECMYHFIRKT